MTAQSAVWFNDRPPTEACGCPGGGCRHQELCEAEPCCPGFVVHEERHPDRDVYRCDWCRCRTEVTAVAVSLPWALPGREQWLRLEPHHDPDRPYALVAGTTPGRVHTSLSAAELRALRDAIDAILNGQEVERLRAQGPREGLGVSEPPTGHRSCVCGGVDGPDGPVSAAARIAIDNGSGRG